MKQKRPLPTQLTRLNTLAFLWNNYRGLERLEHMLKEKYLWQWPARNIKNSIIAGVPSLTAAADKTDTGIAVHYLAPNRKPSEEFLKSLIQEKRRAHVIASDTKWLVYSGQDDYEMLLDGLSEIQAQWPKLDSILGQHYEPETADTAPKTNIAETPEFHRLHENLVEAVFCAAGARVEDMARGFFINCPECDALVHKLVLHEQETSESDYFLGEVFASCKKCYSTWKEHSAINPHASFAKRRQPRCQCGEKFYYMFYAESYTDSFYERAALGGECIKCRRIEIFFRDD